MSLDLTPAPATRVREAVRTLTPGYFAVVMATGIVSIAMQAKGARTVSVLLLWIAAVAYGVLVVLTAWRLRFHRADFVSDLKDPRRAFGLFTFVAATDVLGARLAADAHTGAAFALLGVGAAAWFVLGYVIPWTAVLGHARRPVLQDANGTWFIWVVASQSICVLAARIEPTVGAGRRELALLAVFCWSIGVCLYIGAGIFVAARLLMFPLEPSDLTPPYWVAMGATAITTVGGARIAEMADAPVVSATRDLIADSSVIFWCFGTWLIPVLIAASIWRHVVHRVPLTYEATLWSVVFPLGMYGVGSLYLGDADHLPLIHGVGSVEVWIALAVWALTFVAMLRHLAVTLVGQPKRPEM